MKKSALLCLLAAGFAHAEFAQVQDPDGYTNLRAKPNAQSKIISKIPTGTYVYTPIEGEEYRAGSWLVAYDLRQKPINGWLNQSRVLPLQNYPKMAVQANQNGYSCLKNGMGVEVSIGKFDFAAHQKEFTKQKDGYISHYRGKEMYGTDGTQPATYFREIRFVRNGKTTVAPAAQYEHLFNPYFANPQDAARLSACHYRAADDTLFLTTVIGDGAAFTEVLFVFQQGNLKTVLAALHPAV